jgi:thioredoxin reductase (NADPH)
VALDLVVVYALGGSTPAGFLQATGIQLEGDEPLLKEEGETSVPGLFLTAISPRERGPQA